jgi:hypothetical protein
MVQPGRTPRPMLRGSPLTVSLKRVRRDALPRLLDWQGEASDLKDGMAAGVPTQNSRARCRAGQDFPLSRRQKSRPGQSGPSTSTVMPIALAKVPAMSTLSGHSSAASAASNGALRRFNATSACLDLSRVSLCTGPQSSDSDVGLVDHSELTPCVRALGPDAFQVAPSS